MNQRTWLSFACFLLLSGTAASASEWTDKFKVLDSDGSGSVSRTEYDANVSKLKLDPAPQFSAVDTDATTASTPTNGQLRRS